MVFNGGLQKYLELPKSLQAEFKCNEFKHNAFEW